MVIILLRMLCSLKTRKHCLIRETASARGWSRREILKALSKSLVFNITDCIHHYRDQRNHERWVPPRLPLHPRTYDETSADRLASFASSASTLYELNT
ncbi:hypothetical protein Y032_0038g3570 [Ancylostoma ceylanicum]|uniref:Uncharacterized protein n=1 Tax=Ancylostoma ceylanicum TaxID=53326 RepID=A0A016UJI7_9BILA|nr:hypothetical protein Y032_0038g3570 [Ancylostoma ceylanicum]